MQWLIGLDHQLFFLINSTLTAPWADWFFPEITDLHKTWEMKLFFPLFMVLCLWRPYGLRSLILLVGCAAAVMLADGASTHLLKHRVMRTRPFETAGVVSRQLAPAYGQSFPSNHSVNSWTVATFFAPFVPWLAPVLYIVAALVCYSRVYCGVHFPLDVLSGALIGIFMGSLFARVLGRWVGQRRFRGY